MYMDEDHAQSHPNEGPAGVVDLEARRLGGFSTLARLIHSQDSDTTSLAACVLALGARYLHEYRVLLVGLQDTTAAADSAHVLKGLAELYCLPPPPRTPIKRTRAKKLAAGRRLLRPAARDACLYGACVASATWLSFGGRNSPLPPQRLLVGKHLEQAKWINRACEAIVADQVDHHDAEVARQYLSMLSCSVYDCASARAVVLGSGVLPMLHKRFCRPKGPESAELNVQLHALCVINNCLSGTDVRGDAANGLPQGSSAESLENPDNGACAAVDTLTKAGLVSWLYHLVTIADLSSVDDNCADVIRTLAVEGLTYCVVHSPARVLNVLKEKGALATFTALAEGPELVVQRWAVFMLAAVVGLLGKGRRRVDGSVVAEGESIVTRKVHKELSSLSAGKGSSKRLGTAGAGWGSVAAAGSAEAKLTLTAAGIVQLLCQTGALPCLAWLLRHYDAQVRRDTWKVFQWLKQQRSNIAIALTPAAEPTDGMPNRVEGGAQMPTWPEAMIEQGCVLILHRCGHAEHVESRTESMAVAQAMLQLLQTELLASDLLMRLVLKTAAITVSHRVRSNIAVGILYLSCGASEIRQAFVSNGGLAAVLSMMHNPASRGAAVAFLSAVDSLITQEALPACLADYGLPLTSDGRLVTPMSHVSGGDDDQRDLTEDGPDTSQRLRQKVKRDLVVLVQSTEAVSGRKSVIEMACPSAELLGQASAVLHEELEAARARDEKPMVQGSYKVWEEIMSHIAQPSSFGRSRRHYRPDLLIEMMTVAHEYQLCNLKAAYAVALSSYLDQSTAVSILHAALSVQHAWLAIEAFRVLLRCIDYVCSRSARAIPLAVRLMDEFLTVLLLNSPGE